ncbi:MAG TPA: hypothetical protein PKD58_09690, partial [Candidatus Sumerlaeota bacterium]|nr:hypothetical protein [Candidatus Sumerlaeota bacterium]
WHKTYRFRDAGYIQAAHPMAFHDIQCPLGDLFLPNFGSCFPGTHIVNSRSQYSCGILAPY